MIEQEFVPYEEAFALKELGFNEPCLGYYLCRNSAFGIDDLEITTECIDLVRYDYASCVVPTFSQAFRWLLKNYNLYGIIIPTITMNWTFKTMTVVEDIMEVPPYKHVDANGYKTPEEAELACLSKLIEIVKNK